MIKLLGILFFDVFVAARAKDTTPALAVANLTDPAQPDIMTSQTIDP